MKKQWRIRIRESQEYTPFNLDVDSVDCDKFNFQFDFRCTYEPHIGMHDKILEAYV